MNTQDRVLLVDKPSGLTSFRAVELVRRASKARKVGHCGSLDPGATGLLILTTGVATRLSGLFVDQPKEYDARVRFGRSTTTYDAAGETVETAAVPAGTAQRLAATLGGFIGDIQQVPPMVSALKHEGRRLYELARQGVEVERPARSVRVYGIEFVAHDDTSVDLRVRCGRGCYVRSLAHDLGVALGVPAHLESLRRTAIGPYRVEQASSLDDLRDALRRARTEGEPVTSASVLEVSRAFDFLPSLRVRSGFEASVLQGVQPLPHVFVELPQESGPHRLLSEDGERMLGMCTSDGKRRFAIVRIQRLFQHPLPVEPSPA